MRALLKNLSLSAFMVALATVAAVTCAGVLAMFANTPSETRIADSGLLFFAVLVAGAMAALVGVFFCVVTLFIAAATMPPVLGAARIFKLPRPAIDIIGGAGAGLLCALIGVDAFDTDKFASLVRGPAGQIIACVGLFAGALLGYIRHAVLVRGAAPSAAPLGA